MIGRSAVLVMEFRNIRPCNIGDFSLAQGRQNNAIEQATIYARSAGLALRLSVLGVETFDEISDGRRFSASDLGCCRIGAAFDKPE